MKAALLILTMVFIQILAQPRRFDKYRWYILIPKNEKAIEAINSLDQTKGYYFWNSATAVNATVAVLVSPKRWRSFKKFIKSIDVDAGLHHNNIQKLIDLEQASYEPIEAGEMVWNSYRTLEEINAWLVQLVKDYPGIVKLQDAGKSYENRTIKGVYLSFNPCNSKRAIFLEGNIHAREWISSATITFILNELLTSTDPGVRNLAESHDWYIFPIVNPDGFAYTHEHDRFWRKSRIPYGKCNGEDPNRNWDYHWMEAGASSDPCSFAYAGPTPFSDPATKSLSEYITRISDKLIGYISFHSFSQLIMTPYSHTTEHLDNYDELYEIGLKAAQSLARRYNTTYTVGTFAEVLYFGSGTSVDWVKGTFKTPLTYTYELRDTGKYAFVLPPNQIIPTGLETLDSLVTMFQEYHKIHP